MGKIQFKPQSSFGSKAKKNTGIALIEVLVAVLVLGVGLLGMAAMQSVSSQMTNGAEQRTQAVLLTADMLDRIRANRGAINSYNGVVIDPDNVNCATDFSYNNGQTVAQNDIAEWGNLLACTLPEGEGTVNVNAATGAVTVWIDWQRRDPDGQPVTVTTVI
ncbi:type IV pilus assembly protein PilV [Marinobacter segnicrescens]|uniref:Type IV pilus assembly protein PilV n=1 Tax=Marinobacter segnicrescens TaxID=430453 RepID=A0A1I0GQC7_9GAMM|nr:type IV pilus modification protein PilV [Marinobacter segnicrescens]SET73553.1 type IV pilus assembly protein PilV [Marinobacter segnicrescens]